MGGDGEAFARKGCRFLLMHLRTQHINIKSAIKPPTPEPTAIARVLLLSKKFLISPPVEDPVQRPYKSNLVKCKVLLE